MSAALPSKAGGILPIAGLCCLALAGFLIATTIVLALIPIYVPKKEVTVVTTSADANKFQLAFTTTSNTETDNIAGSVTNLDDVKKSLNLDNDIEVSDGFVQTDANDSSKRRRRRRSLLQRRKVASVSVIITIKINIVCAYKINSECRGSCRDKFKSQVDKSIVAAGPLSVPSLKVNCGGNVQSLSPSSFSYDGIKKQPSPPEGFGAVDSLNFTPLASGDINDPKIWKNGIRPFRGCKVNVPAGIKLGIAQNPYPVSLDQLTIAEGATLELGSNDTSGFVFARALSLVISGTFSFLGTGGAIEFPSTGSFQLGVGAIYSGVKVVFQTYSITTGAEAYAVDVPIGTIVQAIIATITGNILVGGTDVSQNATTTTEPTLSATGSIG